MRPIACPSSPSPTSSKAYAGVPALREVVARPRGRRDPRADGRERRRQVDADQDPRRRRRAGHRRRSAIDGKPVAIDSPRAAHRLGLRFIHQELNVVPALSVAENIFLGRALSAARRRARRLARLSPRRPRRRCARLGITHIDPRAQMARLSHRRPDAGPHLERLPRRGRRPGAALRHGRADRRADPRPRASGCSPCCAKSATRAAPCSTSRTGSTR